MIDKFGKVLLSMVALLVFEAYLYVSEPPSSDLYFILVTILASLLGLLFSLSVNNKIQDLTGEISDFFTGKLTFKARKSKKSRANKKNVNRISNMDMTNERTLVDSTKEYSVLSISLTSFIIINILFALIYM